MNKSKIINWFYLASAIALFLFSFRRSISVLFVKDIWLADFAAYSSVSRAIFEGHNPFPYHFEFLFPDCDFGRVVPIVYPGQMLFFFLPGYFWGNGIQIAFTLLTVFILCFLTGLTLVKACGYQPHDLWMPGKKQFLFAVCCACFLGSCNVMEGLRTGQITVLLAFCLYCLFWGPASRFLQIFLFAFAAVVKYSILPVIAPILFFKGHWKLCIAAFFVFVFLSVSPVLFGNDLQELYTEYFRAVQLMFQPESGLNHYDSNPIMCHLGFFRIPIINHILKAVAVGFILWLFWRERKTRYISDTLMLLGLCLTLLISYHKGYDLTLIFPLLFIRLFDFVKTKQWGLFGITASFLLFLMLPRSVSFLIIPSWIGGLMPRADSVIYMYNDLWGTHYKHVFPIMPFYTIALTLWSMYLYLHVKNPYRFELPVAGADTPGDGVEVREEVPKADLDPKE